VGSVTIGNAASPTTVGGTLGVVGVLTLGSGGTNYTFPTTRGTVNQILQTDGSGVLSWASGGGGSGDVTGPGLSTDHAIARFHETTGKIIQNSGVTIDDSNNLVVPGDISYVTLTQTSDRRVKENIVELDSQKSLEKISKLRPVSFNYTPDWQKISLTSLKSQEGLIAQEAVDVYPEIVSVQKKKLNGENLYGIDYTKLIPTLLSAVQGLQKEVVELKLQLSGR